MKGLMIHRPGGFEATVSDLGVCPVPESTRHYKPVSHLEIRKHVLDALSPAGLRLEREGYGLSRDGRRMFGVLDVRRVGGVAPGWTQSAGGSDWALSIGVRNSYDRSLAVGLCAGSRVFVCDNLAFSGEVRFGRKHTRGVWEDLPDLTAGLLGDLIGPFADRQVEEIEAMKGGELSPLQVDHLILSAFRRRVIPAGDIPDVIHNWREPKHEEFRPRTAWSLFNAFTEVFKMSPAHLQVDRSLRLSKLFREAVPAEFQVVDAEMN